jgi:hypothetical protein
MKTILAVLVLVGIAICSMATAQQTSVMGQGSSGLPERIGSERGRLKVTVDGADGGAIQVQGTVATSVPDGGLQVTGPLTDTQIRASPLPTTVTNADGGSIATNGLTDTQLRADGGVPTKEQNEIVLMTSIGACAGPGGDGGTVALTAGVKYRCVARGSSMCLSQGAPVTTCSVSASMAPAGLWWPQDIPERLPARSDSTVVDGGSATISTIYLATPSGTGCFSCSELR